MFKKMDGGLVNVPIQFFLGFLFNLTRPLRVMNNDPVFTQNEIVFCLHDVPY